MKPKRLIVFDMDGVLIDVSASYRDVVRQTAMAFFQPARSSEKLPDPLFSLSELSVVKQSGGLNNDWDLTYRIVQLLFTLVKKPKGSESVKGWNGYNNTLSCLDVGYLAQFLKTEKKPLKALLKKNKKPNDEFISTYATEDVGSDNIIKQIFQEIYLGPDLFKATYGIAPRVYTGEGYIHRETLLAACSVLATLFEHHTLAIATGRPKNEADFAINQHGIGKYFDVIYTLDNCIREEKKILRGEGRQVSLSKPNPYMLDAIATAVRYSSDGAYYIGDMPDDMIAAKRSRFGFKGVGCLFSAPDKADLKRELLRSGADYIIEDLNQLEKIIASGPG